MAWVEVRPVATLSRILLAVKTGNGSACECTAWQLHSGKLGRVDGNIGNQALGGMIKPPDG